MFSMLYDAIPLIIAACGATFQVYKLYVLAAGCYVLAVFLQNRLLRD